MSVVAGAAFARGVLGFAVSAAAFGAALVVFDFSVASAAFGDKARQFEAANQTEEALRASEEQYRSLAEAIPGPSTEAFQKIARRRKVVIVASLFEKRAEGLYHNTAAIIDADGSFMGMYRKMHIPDDPLYYEKFYFTPGDTGFKAWKTRYATIGVLVCWDQWYPEGARLTALHGAQILFYPTAIGWQSHEKAQFGATQHDAWETMMRSHAIANGVFVVAVNRRGYEGPLNFWGASVAYAPDGSTLAKLPHDDSATVVVECDLSRIEWSRTRWPFFRDRRIDFYGGVLEKWLA